MNHLKTLTLSAVVAAIAAAAFGFREPPATQPATQGERCTTPSGLVYIITEPSDGAARYGDTVSMRYTGRFPNGEEFDSNVGKEPLEFTLGVSRIIKGWHEGITGMKVGEKRHLIIPPALAYGVEGRPGIPSNATLEFDVELLGIRRK